MFAPNDQRCRVSNIGARAVEVERFDRWLSLIAPRRVQFLFADDFSGSPQDDSKIHDAGFGVLMLIH
jgi:hypothetical protein